MPLMGKKAPTAQDVYRARKQREEEEKLAYLPPGLINHGNTCFMNSVLQGLIATPMLSDIVRFSLPESHLGVSSRRSPQLTNGHGRGGQWDHQWEQGMPLGDVFLKLMEASWKLQDDRERASLSPKEILAMLGTKYDQYLDFRQQDAHELLRHLLDAMRMEELDVIKKRYPPPPQVKGKRANKDPHPGVPTEDSASAVSHYTSPRPDMNVNGTSAPDYVYSSTSSESLPEEERPTTFADMVFGGQLASILVCERCKKVSCTYEDFNDLSLSIKPEDDDKARKRDKLKKLALKLKRRSGLDLEASPRASSVPASPTRKTMDLDTVEQATVTAVLRRRSMDPAEERVVVDETASTTGVYEADVEVKVEPPPEGEDGANESGNAGDGDKSPDQDRVSWKEDVKKEDVKNDRTDKGKDKDKDEDAWGKLGRRISVSMKLSKKEGDRSKSKEKEQRKQKEKEKTKGKTGEGKLTSMEFWTDIIDIKGLDVKSPTPKPAHNPRVEDATPLSTPPPDAASRHNSPAPVMPAPSLSSTPVSQSYKRHSSTPGLPAKAPRPYKPSRTDSAYLRRILADVPSSSSNPFAVLRAPPGSASDSRAIAGLWTKLGNVQSVEDCLRMFTAVEVLDGENRVGCRRCWKIEHGEYVVRGRTAGAAEACSLADDDSSSSSSDDERDRGQTRNSAPPAPTSQKSTESPATTITSVHSTQASSLDLNDGDSVTSVPTTAQSFTTLDDGGEFAPPLPPKDPPLSLEEPIATYGGLPIPSISTTGPESRYSPPSLPVDDVDQVLASANLETELPEGPPTARPTAHLVTSPSKVSLMLPRQHFHSRRPAEDQKRGLADSSSPSSDDSGDEVESNASMTNSFYSEDSSLRAPPSQSLATTSPSIPDQQPAQSLRSSTVPRSKQVVFRRSYKRYLISKPPPVLVIHLKRFQQVGKSPVQFFSNFKKLDDFVSFPEYLDLQPFLLPKKETHGFRSNKKTQQHASEKHVLKGEDKCLYRLYAVVVHIGNMLGGHYIAYTALPEPAPGQSSKDRGLLDTVTHPPNVRTVSFENSSRAKGKHAHAPPRQWCYISDTIVRLTSLEEVLKAKAYICMYERIGVLPPL